MLSDNDGRAGTVYGVYDDNAGVEKIRQIQAFQVIKKSKGTEATPSGWRPGKMTLKSGPELVGNVWKVWKTKMAFD